MSEYIDRDYVLKLLGVFNDRVHGDYHFMNGIETAKEIVEDAPSSDVAPVVHGKNLKEEYPTLFQCSVCGCEDWDTSEVNYGEYNYCPNCGARIDGGENG